MRIKKLMFAAVFCCLAVCAAYSQEPAPAAKKHKEGNAAAVGKSKKKAKPNTEGRMEAAEALRITKAWAEESGSTHSLQDMEVAGDGSFTVEAGGAFFRYKPDSKTLLVSGLVAYNLKNYFTVIPADWESLMGAATRERSTLAEGHLELVKEQLLRWKPDVVLLTKPFVDNKINNRRFFTEVRWLLEWGTYWRTRRYSEVLASNDENALIREAAEINEWIKKNRPRPW